jgi:hypothetical protein
MNRIVRAAGFAAAALALVAGASYSDPARAGETAAAVSPAAASAPAVPNLSDPNVFARMWTSVTELVTPRPEAPVPASTPATLTELVLAHVAVATADREEECLANAVYFEARSEPIEGQLAVAEVVLNRAASGRYPTDLCSVITQKAQFSFIRRGKFPRANRDSEAWKKAVAIAAIARQKLAGSLPSGVLWYHASYVSPSWGKRLTKQSQIGLHIFYS